MKLTTYLLVFILLIIPFQSASAKNPKQNEVRLVANQVDGADDIEAAIIAVTENGTRPGTVILDGKKGPFVFSARDKSLNIFVSDLTLRGDNKASIVNCDDGLYFEGATVQRILVENIAFTCTGDGVEAAGVFKDVTLRKNTFNVGLNGILSNGAYSSIGTTTPITPLPSDTTTTPGGSTTPGGTTTVPGSPTHVIPGNGAPTFPTGTRDHVIPGNAAPTFPGGSSTGWTITENVINAKLDGIRISGAVKFVISKNVISATKGVVLLKTSESEVRQNEIHATQIGILIGQESTKNIIQANKISGVNQSGIALEPSVSNNKIEANKVSCAADKSCLAIETLDTSGKNNKITGNTLVKG